MPKAPWEIERGTDAVVAAWIASRQVKPCLLLDETVPGSDGEFSPIPPGLAPNVHRALRKRGVDHLYSHQARAVEEALSGRRAIVVATPTASGKSLCFHLPVLHALSTEPEARALYLYPTKALSRDQEASFRALAHDAGLDQGAVVYDGDTPGDARRSARERSHVVLTNPDMLHTGILPHHAAWAKTFRALRYVVVDELHTYKGVFGSHVANVLRRLLRVAAFHGSRPALIAATATIANPKEHAARLFGVPEEDVALVAENGAPRGPKRVFLYNPPVVNAELQIRASYVKQATRLAADLVRAKVPTILFGQSRNGVEVMLRYLRERVAPEVRADQVMAYRGGYLPEERRAIERRLREGEILAVVSTSALELGVDVGSLDAVICAGYPGSVAALWQRFGRAGRRGGTSLCVLVTSSAPVDQYVAGDSKYLLGAPVEEARIDPANVEILVQHLKCAAFELPFGKGEAFGSLGAESTKDALSFLVTHQVLHEANGRYHWATDSYPANNVSLRSVGWDNVVIIDVGTNKSFAELDWRAAHTMLHEQAIYQHDAGTYQVERFDYENHKAYVRRVEPDYYTDAMTYLTIAVLEEEATARRDGGTWAFGHGEVSLVEKVVGYKKIKFFTHENEGYGDVHLPEMQMHTASFWLTVPAAECALVPGGPAAAIDALRGIGAAIETVATLRLMCDPKDLGATLGDADEDEHGMPVPGGLRAGGGVRGGSPTLFVYEHTPGGLGLAARIFEEREAILLRALRLVERCPCPAGCPACVGPAAPTIDGDGAVHTRKDLALSLLRRELPSA